MYTVPFHWEAMSSNVLPLSEYCNAMSNFYQSDLLSLWHVVTCCLESCVNWGARQLTDFSVLPCGVQALEGIERGTKRDRGVAGLRDRPFILKGLFTTVISAWGTGYNARYQGIKVRFVQQAYFLVGLTEMHFFFFCAWEMCLSENPEEHYQCHYLKKKLAWCRLPPLCSFFVAEQNFLCRVHFVSEILFQDPCSPSCWCVYHMYSSVCWDPALSPLPTNQRQRQPGAIKWPNTIMETKTCTCLVWEDWSVILDSIRDLISDPT